MQVNSSYPTYLKTQNTQKNNLSFKALYLDMKDIEKIGGKAAVDSFTKVESKLRTMGEFYNIKVVENNLEPGVLAIRVTSKPSIIKGESPLESFISGLSILGKETEITSDSIINATRKAIFSFIDEAKEFEKTAVRNFLHN